MAKLVQHNQLKYLFTCICLNVLFVDILNEVASLTHAV